MSGTFNSCSKTEIALESRNSPANFTSPAGRQASPKKKRPFGQVLVAQLRSIIRWGLAAVIVFILVMPGRAAEVFYHLPGLLSPLLSVSKLTFRGWSWALLPAVLFVGMVLWKRRWFCRWICPLGAVNEVATRLGRYLALPTVRFWPVGQLLGTAAVTATLLGLPLLLWLDPMAILGGAFTISQWGVGLPVLLVVPLVFAVLSSLLGRGWWCRELCPLGGLQEQVHDLPRMLWPRARIMHLPGISAPGRAEAISSTYGETGSPSPDQAGERRNTLKVARRTALGAGIGAIWALWPWGVEGKSSEKLRPPGIASSEGLFLALCSRCGNCIRACPAGILMPDCHPSSWSGWGAPVVFFDHDFCHLSCTLCGKICPTGAIHLRAVTEKFKHPIGYPIVEGEICLLADERECGLCRGHCPTGAIRLQFSPETYAVLPVVDRQKCTGCGACQVICPTTPRKAIRIVPPGETS